MIPWFAWHTIEIGPLTLQVWGLFVALGIMLSFAILHSRSIARISISEDDIFSIGFYSLIGGFLFARLAHVFWYEPAYYIENPFEIFAFWHGGFSSFGGFFGAVFFAFMQIWRLRLFDRWRAILDEYLFAALYGWMVGRVGCAMIHDHLGVPCSCPLAIKFPNGESRLDMALIEIFVLIPLAVYIFFTRKRMRSGGLVSGVILLYYGVLRLFLDFFRAKDIVGADARFFGLTPGQYCAILLCFCGMALILHTRARPIH